MKSKLLQRKTISVISIMLVLVTVLCLGLLRVNANAATGDSASFDLCNHYEPIVVYDEGEGITAPEDVKYYSYVFVGWSTVEGDITKLTTTFEPGNNYYAVWARDNDESGTYTGDDVIVRTDVLDLREVSEDISNESQGWSWDYDTLTLTLDGVDFMFEANEYLNLPDGATVVVADDSNNYVSYGVYGYGNLTIEGDGTLNSDQGIFSYGSLTLDCATVYTYRISIFGKLYVKSGMVVAFMEMATTDDSDDYDSGVLELEYGAMAVSENIYAENGIFVNGSKISGTNADFVDGETTTLRYDSSLGYLFVIVGEPTIITEADAELDRSAIPALPPYSYKYSDELNDALYNEFKSSNVFVTDYRVLRTVNGEIDNGDRSNDYYKEGYSYVALLRILPEYGSIFADDITMNNDDFTIVTKAKGYIEVAYDLGVSSYPTVYEIDLSLKDKFYDYYYIGGNFYKEAQGMSDILNFDLTEPYIVRDVKVLVYDEYYDEYLEVNMSDLMEYGYRPGVKYALSFYVETGDDYTDKGGIDASEYRFAETVTSKNEGWIIDSYNNYLHAIYTLEPLEAELISEIDISLTDNFYDYYYIGGNFYEEAEGIRDILNFDLTKPYVVYDLLLLIYDEEEDEYIEPDSEALEEYGYQAGVEYTIVVLLETGDDYTEYGGVNALAYRFADTVTNKTAGWTIESNGDELYAFYKLEPLEAETIDEIDLSLGNAFFDNYKIGCNIYEQEVDFDDILNADMTKPYLIDGLNICYYDAEYEKYMQIDPDEFGGFAAGVKYAVMVYVVTGFDFAEYGGIDASGYLFADEVTNKTDGWDITVYEGRFIEALYELEPLEAPTIDEVDISLSDNFSDFYYIGGNIFEEASGMQDIVKIDLTKPYFIEGINICYYDEEYGDYVPVDPDEFGGFVPGVKYAVAAFVVTGYDFSSEGGINASGYVFAREVTNASAGWTVNTLESQIAVAIYELEPLEAETIDEIDLSLGDAFFDNYKIGCNIFELEVNFDDILSIDMTKPYLIQGFNICYYDAEYEEYIPIDPDEFGGFEAGVKYAVAVLAVTGYDFTDIGGINASGYVFAREVTNVDAGWTVNVLEAQAIMALYELEPLSETKIEIDEASLNITPTNSLTYNGTAQTQGITVAYMGETLSLGVDYTVSGNTATNAGNYTLTITFIGDYSGEATYSYSVAKATYDMSGISIANKTVTYSGEAHSIAIVGTLPNGVTVTYTGNGKTDAGVYTVVASFAGDANYNAIADMTATLTVEKATYDMSGVSIANKTVTYNGEAHSIAIVGTLPNGVTVTYTGNGKTDAGVYTIVASFAGDANYNAIADMTATLTVEKATYDMSGISIANKTVTYNGEAHSIAIIGTLPNGVTVTYTGNGKTDAGVYTVVASFAGDANYNAIADMTATLTIKAVVFEDTEKDEETGKPVVKVESDNGFDPNTELVVEVVAVEIETSEIRVEMAENEEIAVAYDVSLMQDGVSVQPNGIIRIKMLIPTNLLGAQFRIVHIHDGEEIGDVDYTVDDIYAVVETDKLSAFVFVGENDGADLDSKMVFIIIGIVLLFLIVLLIILYFVYRAYRERKEEYEERKYTEKQNKKQ